MLDLSYDKQFDILYVSISSTSASYGDEAIDGLVVLRDLFTEDITGITIFDFKAKFERGSLPPLPIKVNIDQLFVDSLHTV